MTNRQLLLELVKQHRTLRELMERSEQLADRVDVGGDPVPLQQTVELLRVAFVAHNAFEERLLKPVLFEADAFAAARIERMVEDHVAEHRAMRARLDDTATSALRDVIESLRAHLDAEEKYLLTDTVLRDDLVTVESSS
jgi:hypothetical protein